MSNHFEDLAKKGIVTTEMSLQELQQLLIEEKITVFQFSEILIENLGEKIFLKILKDTLKIYFGEKNA